MSRKKGNRAQSASEYALLLAVVLACFVGMQTYIKRGVQAKLRGIADDFGDQGAQEPAKRRVVLKVYDVNLTTKSEAYTKTELLAGGARRKILPLEKNITATTGTTEYRHEAD